MDNQPGGYGERRGGFVRVESQEEEERRLTANGWFIQCGRRKLQVTPMEGIVLLYMLVSMSLTLLDKWLITGLGFNAPLALIFLTYLIMHLASLSTRWCLAHRGSADENEARAGGFNYKPLVQQLTWHQWAWKVFPVAAASGLEVGTSTLGLQVMDVGIHTMLRSTVPIFVLLFSVGLGLQEFRCGLLAVVLLVSGGVSLMFSGNQGSADQPDLPMEGFLLTLLSGMLAGLKWTLSQVLLQGRGLYGRGAVTVGEHIHPFTLLHYMSISSAATLVPFVLVLERGALHEMWATFGAERILRTALLIVLVSLLALVLVLTEFTFIKKVSSLSLCIIGVVKELFLVLWSVAVRGEHLSNRTGLGFLVTMVGVTLYKLVPKGPPKVRYELAPKNGGAQQVQQLPVRRGSESTRLPTPTPAGEDAEDGQSGHRASSREATERKSGERPDQDQERALPGGVSSGSRTGSGLAWTDYFADGHIGGAGAGAGAEAGAVWDAAAADARSSAVLNPTVEEVGALGSRGLESGATVSTGGVSTIGFSAGGADAERLRFDIPQ